MTKILLILSTVLVVVIALMSGLVSPDEATLWQYLILFFSIAVTCGALTVLVLRLLGFIHKQKSMVSLVVLISCVVMMLLILSWARALSTISFVLLVILVGVLIWYVRHRSAHK